MVGDHVTAHFFTAQGEVHALQVTLKIHDSLQQNASYWTRALLEKINLHIPFIKAGHYINRAWLVGYSEQPIMSHPSCGIIGFDVSYQCRAHPKAITSRSSEFEYIYPNGQAHYQSGTHVWHPKIQKSFKCKAWPFNEYCRSDDPQFEPGVGELWRIAWQAC